MEVSSQHIRRLLAVRDEDAAPDVDRAIRLARQAGYKTQYGIMEYVRRVLDLSNRSLSNDRDL